VVEHVSLERVSVRLNLLENDILRFVESDIIIGKGNDIFWVEAIGKEYILSVTHISLVSIVPKIIRTSNQHCPVLLTLDNIEK
jgi:hypothetical protein